MPRAGRPRSHGERFACGKIKPAVTLNQIKRGIAAAKAFGKNEWLGSELGRLATYPVDDGAPLITLEQAAAGFAFARLFSDYAQEMGFPRRSAGSGSLELRSPGSDGGEPTERTSGILAAYRAARGKLEAVGALAIVVAVCVDDQAPPIWERERFVAGLNALMRHFVIRKGRLS